MGANDDDGPLHLRYSEEGDPARALAMLETETANLGYGRRHRCPAQAAGAGAARAGGPGRRLDQSLAALVYTVVRHRCLTPDYISAGSSIEVALRRVTVLQSAAANVYVHVFAPCDCASRRGVACLQTAGRMRSPP